MTGVLQESWLAWGLGLTLGFPLVAILLAQFAAGFRRDNHALEGVSRSVLNIFLPLLAVYLTLRYVVDLSDTGLILRVVLTLVLVVAIYLILGFVNAIVFGTAREGTWRAQTPKLLRDLIITILLAVGLVLVMAVVWERDVAGLFAALGVGSVILGFALQETIGNVMLGISLLMERPFSEGDWIEVAGLEGKVTEINWRAVRIQNRDGDMIVIPHAVIAKDIVLNDCVPDTIDRVSVELGFGYDHPPNQVKSMLMETLRTTDGILDHPRTTIYTSEYGDSSINYIVHFFIAHPENKPKIKDRFMTRVWYAAQREKINIPFPIRTVFHHDADKPVVSDTNAALETASRSPLLSDAISLDDLDRFATGAVLKHFGADEILFKQGDRNATLYLLLSGNAQIEVADGAGIDVVNTLSHGDICGEVTVFTGVPAIYRVRAITDIEVLAFSREIAEELIAQKPSLAVEIGQIIDRRRKTIRLMKDR